MTRAVGELVGRALGGGATLAVAADDLDLDLHEASVRALEEPADAPALAAAVAALDDGAFDGALVGGWGEELEPAQVVGALRSKVRPGGVMVLAAPTARPGMRAAFSRLFRRRRACSFEDLCEALLLAGLADIRAEEDTDQPGVAVVWGRVPATNLPKTRGLD